MILSVRTSCCVLCKACALNFLDLLEGGNIDSVRIIDPACGIGACEHLYAELLSLLNSIDSNVAGACDSCCLACNVNAVDLEKLFCKVQKTVACSLCSCKRSAVCKALACEDALIEACDSLILAIKVADLASACADVAGRYVNVCADMSVELCHEALAEFHDFIVGLALRVEVGTALAAADRKACQAVLEYLLETKELDDAEVYGRMETKTSLVRTDCAVVLYTEATVDLDIAIVI